MSTSKLLDDPRVRESATQLIADEISRWLSDPAAQELLHNAIVSEHGKKDIARELGNQMPSIVGNFATGVFHGFRSSDKEQAESNLLSDKPKG